MYGLWLRKNAADSKKTRSYYYGKGRKSSYYSCEWDSLCSLPESSSCTRSKNESVMMGKSKATETLLLDDNDYDNGPRHHDSYNSCSNNEAKEEVDLKEGSFEPLVVRQTLTENDDFFLGVGHTCQNEEETTNDDEYRNVATVTTSLSNRPCKRSLQKQQTSSSSCIRRQGKSTITSNKMSMIYFTLLACCQTRRYYVYSQSASPSSSSYPTTLSPAVAPVASPPVTPSISSSTTSRPNQSSVTSSAPTKGTTTTLPPAPPTKGTTTTLAPTKGTTTTLPPAPTPVIVVPTSSPAQSTSKPIPLPVQNNSVAPSSSLPTKVIVPGPTSRPVITTPLPTRKRTSPPTKAPSRSPTFVPTKSPSFAPTRSFRPSSRPTARPTQSPTTPAPTKFPTRQPTPNPTPNPTEEPTASPTFTVTSVNSQSYRQEFGSDDTIDLLTDDNIFVFQSALEGYTNDYGGNGSNNVETTAKVFNQAQLGVNNTRLAVDYVMQWESNQTDVNGTVPYSFKFLSWMSQPENSQLFVDELQTSGIMVSRSNSIDVLNRPVPMPTPVAPPVVEPTSPDPDGPTVPTPSPSNSNTPSTSRLSQTVIIVIGVAAGGGTLLSCITGFCVYFWCRSKRKKKKNQILYDQSSLSQQQQNDHPSTRGRGGINNSGSNGNRSLTARNLEEAAAANNNNGTAIPVPPGVISSDTLLIDGRHNTGITSSNSCDDQIVHSESLASQPSMLSGIKSVDSDIETDGAPSCHLLDELDNNMGHDKLETMRAGVADNVGGVDEMMSQALIKALTDDDDGLNDMNQLMWGGTTGDGMEIEASVLCETNDWLKRKEGASLDERRNFMQDILNRMVATVRHNIIGPERGSRAIHGAAAMLGLQLAGDLPETALLVSGMRHRVQRQDLYSAFAEFGDIEGCAVAPNSKGFGLVRYISPKAVQRALERYRTDKIDVQDVSVNVRVLTASASSSVVVARTTVSSQQQQQSTNDSNGRNAGYRGTTGGGGGGGLMSGGGMAGSERKDFRSFGGGGGGRGGVMEANHSPMLETIDYPSDSLGRHGEVVRRTTNQQQQQSKYSRRQSSETPNNNNNNGTNGGGGGGGRGASRIL